MVGGTDERILVLDFGSQYAQLIARRVREQHVFCQIVRHDIGAERVRELGPRGLILSGGPASVYERDAPRCDPGLLALGIPVLGICYGMQLVCQVLGARIEPGRAREYGRTPLHVLDGSDLLADVPEHTSVWMSHGDHVYELPDEFVPLASTPHCKYAAVRHRRRPVWCVQFHPEVAHTPEGSRILRNFLFDCCGCRGAWRTETFISETIDRVRERVGDRRVICALSGGVDSSVVTALLQRAIGGQLTCIFVDNG
ncbi:MAG TPA: glutamine-hydrolyzing GMP synthase, partial [Planctomycetaceae bacterium]|nr:glutamine-hydrolyzing GMP synthase [Planctomycetaceae bacterium]